MADPGRKIDRLGDVFTASGPLLALILSAAAIVLYLQFFNTLAVPNPDFLDYRASALSYLQGSLPTSLKRLPLFPLLIGLLSLVMPGPEPERMAAQILNLLLAPICLWLIYRIACEFVRPATALVIVALCAVNREMVYSVAESMQEITILTCSLLTVHLALRASPWAYVAAFAASLTRFEAALLIPLLVLQDRLVTTGARKTRSLLWGFLASLGIIGWIVLSIQHSLKTHPYMEEMLTRQGHLMEFLKGSLRIAVDFLPRALFGVEAARRTVFLAELALLAGGAAVLIRRYRFRTTLLLGFLCTYTVIHTTFPAYVARYVVPILWILYLLMAVAIERLMARIGPPARMPVRWLTGLALCAMVGSGMSSASNFMTKDSIRLKRVQFRRVGEWYRDAAKPGDKMMVQFDSIVQYYSGLPHEAFMSSRALESSAPEALLEELGAKDITYIVWDNVVDPTGYFDMQRKAWFLTWVKARQPAEVEIAHRIHEGPYEAIIYRFHPQPRSGQ